MRLILFGLVMATVSACNTVGFGKPYEVLFSNSTNITIQYDPFLANIGTVQKVAQQHCDKYDRDALPRGVIYEGVLRQANFSCIRRN